MLTRLHYGGARARALHDHAVHSRSTPRAVQRSRCGRWVQNGAGERQCRRGGACAQAQGGAAQESVCARRRPHRRGDPAPVGLCHTAGAGAAGVRARALRGRVPELREGGAHRRPGAGHSAQRPRLLHPSVPRGPSGDGDGAGVVGGGAGGAADEPLGHPPARGRRALGAQRVRRRAAGRGADARAGVHGGRAAAGARQGLLRPLPRALPERAAAAPGHAGAGLPAAAAARPAHHAQGRARRRGALRAAPLLATGRLLPNKQLRTDSRPPSIDFSFACETQTCPLSRPLNYVSFTTSINVLGPLRHRKQTFPSRRITSGWLGYVT